MACAGAETASDGAGMRLEVTEGLGWNAGNRVAYARPSNGEIVLGRYRPGHGFCECCQQVKPRKGKSMKGWKCRDCRRAE